MGELRKKRSFHDYFHIELDYTTNIICNILKPLMSYTHTIAIIISNNNNNLISLFKEIFRNSKLILCNDENDAINTIQENQIDLIFVEHNPRESFDSIKIIQNIRELISFLTPIIVLTNHGSERIAVNAMLAGANDYFIKDEIKHEDFKERIDDVIAKYEVTQKILADLKKYKDLALLDELTNVYNRHGLKDYLSRELSYAIRNDVPLACLYIDIDNFKHINDHYSHNIGDQVLVEVAKRLTISLRKEDIVSRVGGDEFVIICIGLSDKAKVISLSKKILTTMEHQFHISDQLIDVGISIGAAVSDKNSSPDDLLNKADLALKHSKKIKGVFRIYEE